MAKQIDDLDHKIIELRKQGLSDHEIADRLGTSYSRIYHRRRQLERDGLLEAKRKQGKQVDLGLQDYALVGNVYVFTINGRLWQIERERMERICADYSVYGGGMTQAQLAREHGLPIEVVKRILAAYKQYRASLPFTRETVKEAAERGELDTLAEQAVEAQEAALERKIAQKQVERMRARLEQLESQEYVKRKFLAELERIIPQVHVAPVDILPPAFDREATAQEKWAAHIPTTDEHIGKYVWEKEAFGDNYDSDISCQRLVTHAQHAARWIASQPGRCAVAYRTFLGDFFHALTGQTEHGTRLDQDTRSARVWAMGLEAAITSIQALARVAERVEVYGAMGNHDGFSFFQFMHALKLALQADPRITVHVSPRRYSAFRVGTTLHVLDHGYGVGTLTGWKAKAQAEVVAREIAGQEYEGVEQIYTYVGHLHEWSGASLGRHHELIRLPSLGESDEYETSLRFSTAPRAHVYRLDAQGRIETEYRIFAEALRSGE